MGGQSFRRNFQRCRAQATASTESCFSGFDPHTKQLGSLSATNSADALFLRDDHDEEGHALANRRTSFLGLLNVTEREVSASSLLTPRTNLEPLPEDAPSTAGAPSSTPMFD